MAKANSKDSKPNKHESIHGDPSGESALQGIQFFNISNETSDLGHREELEADKNIPTETILPPPVSLPLPLNSLNSDQRMRAIILRYTGEIREVDPELASTFESSLAKGVYFLIKFSWPQSNKSGKLLGDLQKEVSEIAVDQAPEQLREYVMQWFNTQIERDIDTENPKVFRLRTDPDNYKSPLAPPDIDNAPRPQIAEKEVQNNTMR